MGSPCLPPRLTPARVLLSWEFISLEVGWQRGSGSWIWQLPVQCAFGFAFLSVFPPKAKDWGLRALLIRQGNCQLVLELLGCGAPGLNWELPPIGTVRVQDWAQYSNEIKTKQKTKSSYQRQKNQWEWSTPLNINAYFQIDKKMKNASIENSIKGINRQCTV